MALTHFEVKARQLYKLLRTQAMLDHSEAITRMRHIYSTRPLTEAFYSSLSIKSI